MSTPEEEESRTGTALSDAEPEERRATDAAVVLPILGLALFTPPVIGIFAAETSIFGTPAAVLSIFGIWAGLILLAFCLSRTLPARDVDDGT